MHLSFVVRRSVASHVLSSCLLCRIQIVVPFRFNLNVYPYYVEFHTIMPSPMKKVRKCIDENVLAFSKLTEHGFAPIRGTDYSAGYDLKSAYSYVVKAHGKELIKTDIQIKVPQGTYGRIAPRSGLAWKNFIDVGAGVIDSDYRGNVGVLLYNHSDDDFIVNKGDRVAQLICEKIVCPEVVELETLDDTDRGEGGFGSTGTN
ncbi:hypothetical protein ACI65C_010314 [Semiaphis heraclei]